MISSEEAMQALKSLSRITVAFVSREGAILIRGTGKIERLSEESFWMYSQNGMQGFSVPLKVEGTTFSISVPRFALSKEEWETLSWTALFSTGLLIDFPEDNRWIFLMEPPKGW